MARTFLAFRIEHVDTGEGPYNGPDWPGRDDMAFDHSNWAHPSPTRDPALRRYMTFAHFCGLDSPERLYAWFVDHWDALAGSAEDYVVRIFRARHGSARGHNGQVIFRKDTATVLDTLTLDTFVGLFEPDEEDDLPSMKYLTPDWP